MQNREERGSMEIVFSQLFVNTYLEEYRIEDDQTLTLYGMPQLLKFLFLF